MFELNHETLYLAVKLSDLYLSNKVVTRDELQLIGATAVLLSSKLHVRFFRYIKIFILWLFKERYPPYLVDIIYCCDEKYSWELFVQTELKMMSAFKNDINQPIAYVFLRRYGNVMEYTMQQV